MAVTILRDGYGVVEPNHLSAPRNGQVYAQLPAATGITVLEQGMFVKYDIAAGEVNFTGDGPWMLVFNEEKLYDDRHQMHKDFALKTADSYDGKIYPRVFAVNPGDIFTTNMVKTAAAGTSYAVGDKLEVGTDGILYKPNSATAGAQTFKVVKETTLPDGQKALKIQVIA